MRTLIAAAALTAAWGQTAAHLTLAEAQQLALRNHPALQAAQFGAQAAGERVSQAEAAKKPFAGASVSGVGAADASRIGAGALNNPIILSRLGAGVSVTQMVTDFGRTDGLIASTKLLAEADAVRVRATRAEILMQVQRAYFSVLRSRTVVAIAKSTVEARQLLVDQVAALVSAQLKSGLDLSVASTNLAEAKLLVSAAENESRAAMAQLGEALGYGDAREFELEEEPMPAALPLTPEELRAQALKDRPELIAGRLDTSASKQMVLAERALKYPTVTAMGAAGVIPVRVSNLSSDYAAAGVNITLPFLNGGLFKARQREAALKASQAEQRVRQMENAVSRDVAVALLDVRMAEERIGLTLQLVAQASQALELAQSRYDLGLSSIVELSQAQLTKTNAEIQNAAARYDYQTRRAILDYRTGKLQ